MASVNKVIVLGNVGQDPELRHTPSGMAVCNVSIATSRNRKDKEGQRQEETEWHRVVFYDRLAEIAGEYLKKGRPVYVEGRLKTRKWQDKEGKDIYTTEVIAEQMQMLGSREEGGHLPAREPAPPQRQGREPAQRQGREPAPQRARQAAPGGFDDMDDDIPF